MTAPTRTDALIDCFLGHDRLTTNYYCRSMQVSEKHSTWASEITTYNVVLDTSVFETQLRVAAVIKQHFEPDTRAQEPGRLDEVEHVLKEAIDLQTAALGPNHEVLSATIHHLGVCVLEAGGRLREAEELFKRALGIQTAHAYLGPDKLDIAATLLTLGIVVDRAGGRLDEVEHLFKRALYIYMAKLGEDDLIIAYTLQLLGTCVYGAGGRLGEAEEFFKRALDIWKAKLGSDNLVVSETLCSLGRCAFKAGRLREAEELFTRALDIQMAKISPDHLEVASTLTQLGVIVYAAGGRLDEVEILCNRVLDIYGAKLGSNHLSVGTILACQGTCVAEAGRYREAEEMFKRALQIQTANRPGDLEVVSTLNYHTFRIHKDGRQGEEEDPLKRTLGTQSWFGVLEGLNDSCGSCLANFEITSRFGPVYGHCIDVEGGRRLVPYCTMLLRPASGYISAPTSEIHLCDSCRPWSQNAN